MGKLTISVAIFFSNLSLPEANLLTSWDEPPRSSITPSKLRLDASAQEPHPAPAFSARDLHASNNIWTDLT